MQKAAEVKEAEAEKSAVVKSCTQQIKEAEKAARQARSEAQVASDAAAAASEKAESLTFTPDPKYLLQVRHLRKFFPIKKDFFGRPTANLRAVDDVSFDLERGKTLGIVGESGCGKTTMGRTILKLHQPSGGDIYFDGQNIAPLSSAQVRPLRTRMQIIFQDPYSSLPPRMPVGSIIGEAVKVHKIVPKSELHSYVLDIMDKCGLRDYYFERYPHEFSGGQRQRICIARALAVNPQLIVCDEPVSALDVSIQAQIINLLKDLQQSMGLTYLFISHDLSVVKHISDNVGVMYLGSMVEFGSNASIFSNPMHPYTRALFSAVPVPDPKVKMNRIILSGDIPSPANPPSGCKFHTRCPACMDICKEKAPVYREYEKGHFVACHLWPQE
ncbi:MAG: dipeptide ABC transporter ATP-binding protein [Clostridiales bacterium]|nr:dipeptide ABC transporter ATP-binding protein [Clostridiales bacterium]